MLETALAYRQAGRSVLPIAPGEKRPSITTDSDGVVGVPWDDYKKTPANEATIRSWFPLGQLMGIAIACGPVSGMTIDGVPYGLEIIDIDDAETLDAFNETANFQGLSALLERLLHQRTPGGAGHYAYLCQTWAGNQKLAQRQDGVDANGKPIIFTLIETRGEGGQAVVAPTPPGIHPEVPERGYTLVRGDWEHLPIITPEERHTLLDLARSFHTYAAPEMVRPVHGESRKTFGNGDRPGDWLNRTATLDWWRALLERHGWTLVYQRRDIQYWQRPGKDGKAWSATLGACGPYLYVFSSNASPFEPEKAYSPFAAVALLDHRGDFRQTARALLVHQFAEACPAGADLVPLLENLLSTPDSRAVFDAASQFARLDRETWGACKRVLKGLLGDALNLLDLDKRVKQARRTARSAALSSGVPGQSPSDDNRPTIVVTTDMTAVVDRTITAIQGLPNAPQLFQRARLLTVITTQSTSPRWLLRPPDLPVIAMAGMALLRELAAKAARWETAVPDDSDKEPRSTLPPAWAIDTLQARPGWSFPYLEGIVCSPTLRQDGSVLATPGYDFDTGLYLDFNRVQFPTVPDHPTRQDAINAVAALCEPFADFPFVAPCHLSATLAAVCSVVARHAIPGNVPLFAVRSTTRGSGKGLLIDVISMLALGRQAPRMAQTLDEEEERKRLLSIALDGTPLLHIDNVTQLLGSGPLDMALTAPTFGDRLLGRNVTKEAPMNAVFFASGNNMAFRSDLVRRVVPIDLDPKVERPEERTGFQHSPLLPWVQKQRPRLVVAALTLLRAFCVAGRPSQRLKPMGSFDEWTNLVRQTLVWAGEPDPDEARRNLEADSDPEYERLAALLDAWVRCYPKKEKKEEEKKTLAQVLGDIQIRQSVPSMPPNEWDDLHGVLGDLDRRFDGNRLDTRAIGDVFRKFQGRTIDGKRLVKAGDFRRAAQWRVEGVTREQSLHNSVSHVSQCESFSPSLESNMVSLEISTEGGGERKEERGKIKVNSIGMTHTDSHDSHILTDSPDPSIPETAQHACPRCGEVISHVTSIDGGLACTRCSPLPDSMISRAENGGDDEERMTWTL